MACPFYYFDLIYAGYDQGGTDLIRLTARGRKRYSPSGGGYDHTRKIHDPIRMGNTLTSID